MRPLIIVSTRRRCDRLSWCGVWQVVSVRTPSHSRRLFGPTFEESNLAKSLIELKGWTKTVQKTYVPEDPVRTVLSWSSER